MIRLAVLYDECGFWDCTKRNIVTTDDGCLGCLDWIWGQAVDEDEGCLCAYCLVGCVDVGCGTVPHGIAVFRVSTTQLIARLANPLNPLGSSRTSRLSVSRSVSPASGSKWGKSYCGSEKISGPRRTQFLQPRTGQGLRVRHRGPITILQVNPGPKSYPIDQSTSPAVILRTGARIAAAFPCCDRPSPFCPLPSALCARRCGPAKAALG